MKRWLILMVLVFIGAAGWRIGGSLSSDALSMAVGVLFGVMAGLPTALLVMAGSRRASNVRAGEMADMRGNPMRGHGQAFGQSYGQIGPLGMPYPQQPPIIIVAGPHGASNAFQPASSDLAWTPQDVSARHFTLVGEQETFVDEW